MKIILKKLNSLAMLPRRATTGSAGLDIYAALEEPVVINPGRVAMIPTGLSCEMPNGLEAQVRSRSGLALRNIFVANSPGTIDSDFRGEIFILLRNGRRATWIDRIRYLIDVICYGPEEAKTRDASRFVVYPGDRIAQLVFSSIPLIEVEWGEVGKTERGAGGFGSTGV
jgi:dUTP pyrophosphatase